MCSVIVTHEHISFKRLPGRYSLVTCLRILVFNLNFSCLVKDEPGEISGYIIAHKGYVANRIGPWVASDACAAESLLAALFREIEGERVFLDVPDPNVVATQLMQRYGFEVQRGFCRMYLGDNNYPGKPEKIYATSSAEKG